MDAGKSASPDQMVLVLTEDSDDSKRPIWELHYDYRFWVGPGSIVTIPQGYRTNLGTVPRFLWSIASPAELRQASVIHDCLCNEWFGGVDEDSGYSRFMADAIFYEAMRRFGIATWKATLVFWAVRAYARWQQ